MGNSEIRININSGVKGGIFRMKRVTFLVLSTWAFLVATLSGCEHAPPEIEGLKAKFEARRGALIQISEIVIEEHLQSVFFAPGTGRVKLGQLSASGEYDRVILESDVSKELHNLMFDVEAETVHYEGGRVYIGLRDIQDSGKSFLVNFVRTSQAGWATECQDQNLELREGFCAVQLEEEWWVAYSWYSDQ